MCIRLKSIGKLVLLGLRETRQLDGMVSLPVYCRMERSSIVAGVSLFWIVEMVTCSEVKPDCVTDDKTPSRCRRPDDAPDGR
jgi:hypothetical protein